MNVRENATNFVLSPRGDKVPSIKIMGFSMFSRFTFEQIQWIIPVTEKSLSEQCEGGLKCCATGKPEFVLESSSSLLLWSPSITDDDDFLFNVESMTQHEEEESMC